MKKFALITALFLASGTSFVLGQAATPTPLIGCCMQASSWTVPGLGSGSGVAIDRTLKRVYATDNTNGIIKAFNYDGTTASSFGGGTGQVTMAFAFGVAVGPPNYPGIYGVTRNAPHDTVSKFDTNGNLVWTSLNLQSDGEFCICVDDYGNSYVSNGNNHIFVLDNDGTQKIDVIASSGVAVNGPVGLFMQGLQLWVSDRGNNRFVQFTETGVNSYSYNLTGAVTISTPSPYGLTKGLDGNYYVAFQDSSGYQIYDGQFNPIAAFCSPEGGALWPVLG